MSHKQVVQSVPTICSREAVKLTANKVIRTSSIDLHLPGSIPQGIPCLRTYLGPEGALGHEAICFIFFPVPIFTNKILVFSILPLPTHAPVSAIADVSILVMRQILLLGRFHCPGPWLSLSHIIRRAWPWSQHLPRC